MRMAHLHVFADPNPQTFLEILGTNNTVLQKSEKINYLEDWRLFLYSGGLILYVVGTGNRKFFTILLKCSGTRNQNPILI